jgi:hypothetical protein
MSEPRIPQPREGITGTLRDEDDLLSLDEKAIPRRAMMCAMAKCLQRAVTVGQPAPVVQRMSERMRHPQPGDLVVETSRMGRQHPDVEAFGILLAHRREWWSTDAEWAAEMAGEPEELRGTDNRPTDHAWYVQYGPRPEDVCRWVNCEFIAIPLDPREAEIPVGTRDGSGVTITRDDLLGSLADSGFQLRPPG